MGDETATLDRSALHPPSRQLRRGKQRSSYSAPRCRAKPDDYFFKFIKNSIDTFSALRLKPLLHLGTFLKPTPENKSQSDHAVARRHAHRGAAFVSTRTTPMKKQLNPTIKAHLIRSAFYLFCFWASAQFHLRWRSPAVAGLPGKAWLSPRSY